MQKVLVADDHLVTRKLLQVTLEKNGYSVVTAEDGAQAWEYLQSEPDIRLVILDWIMPKMDGVEICSRLRQEQKAGIFYIILLTAREGTENITTALQAGANDYVIKPFEKEELLARLRVGQRIITLQRELTQAQKLESIGQLASGIAHEINTPIQYVGDNIRFMQEGFADLSKLLKTGADIMEQLKSVAGGAERAAEWTRMVQEVDLDYLTTEIPQAIQQSIEGVEHISTIVRAMKEFAHPGVTQKTALDINQAVQSTITVATNRWKYVANVETDFDPDLPLVPALGAEFNQVVLNLILNAVDAITDVVGEDGGTKGTITVRTRTVDDGVEIHVADTGGGIPREIQDKIFNPFFTTKQVGKGSGQGLSICQSIIVDKHGGKIRFESAKGEGTTFVIWLPLAHPSDESTMEGGHERQEENSLCG
ncbi:MAG: response regulator [Sedimentisphaerales bacterium]|nr:response regulator [Sedimentisphaerales bacterium]